MSAHLPPLPNPSPTRGEGLDGQTSSPLAGARREAVGRRGGNLLPLAKRMRHEPTDAERKLWALLRAKRLQGWKFRRQQPIGNFIADFVCLEARLIVEADGSQHADSAADRARDAFLSSQCFQVLRLWNNDILTNPEGVATAIIAALAPLSPTALP